MPIDWEKLKDSPRILTMAALRPVAGTRIQPTGFPDLGAATYDAPDGRRGTIPTLLVESAQSMANRLEAVCWDEATDDLVPELKGLPYVRVKLAGLGDGSDTTSSLLEFHRLNSPYIMSGTTPEGTPFADLLTRELRLSSGGSGIGGEEGDAVAGVVNLRRLAAVCFKYDPNSLVHGVFLEKIAGRLRHPRSLSAFIEATGVGRADSGGVKFDRVMPQPVKGLDAATGYGNVPFHRTEFTAASITAYFSLDLAQLRGYGLPAEAYKLLLVLSLWKVRKFLDSNMRLRSACELELMDDEKGIQVKRPDGEKGIQVKRPDGFPLPPTRELESDLRTFLDRCKSHFASPSSTELIWNLKARTGGEIVIELPPNFPPPRPFKEPLKSLVDFKKKTAKAPPRLVLKKGLTEDFVKQVEDALGKEDEVSKVVRAKLEGNEPAPQNDKE
jgi:CRISPR-associated protein Csb1